MYYLAEKLSGINQVSVLAPPNSFNNPHFSQDKRPNTALRTAYTTIKLADIQENKVRKVLSTKVVDETINRVASCVSTIEHKYPS